MIGRVAQAAIGHDSVGHGRKDAAQPVLAVQPLGNPVDCRLDGTLARVLRQQRLADAQRLVDGQEQIAPRAAGRVGQIGALFFRRHHEQFADVHGARVQCLRLQGRQHQQRHDHRARPIGHLAEMERRPARQQHDLRRHHWHRAPRHLFEQSERETGEDIGARRAAGLQDGLAGAPHVRRLDIVAAELQREVRLDRGADVELAAMEQRPAAMVGLGRPQINGELLLDAVVDLAGEMLEHDVLGGDGGIRLQLEAPVAFFVLARLQIGRCFTDRTVDLAQADFGQRNPGRIDLGQRGRSLSSN